MKIISVLILVIFMILSLCSCAAENIHDATNAPTLDNYVSEESPIQSNELNTEIPSKEDEPALTDNVPEEPPIQSYEPSIEIQGNENEAIIIMPEDINDTLEIMFLFWEDYKIDSFNSGDMEWIYISESRDYDGYYEIIFSIKPDAIRKAELPIVFVSDLLMKISVDNENICKFLNYKNPYINNEELSASCFTARSSSDITEGIKHFICFLNENNIKREVFKDLFTKGIPNKENGELP